jgi:hypothetical protein
MRGKRRQPKAIGMLERLDDRITPVAFGLTGRSVLASGATNSALTSLLNTRPTLNGGSFASGLTGNAAAATSLFRPGVLNASTGQFNSNLSFGNGLNLNNFSTQLSTLLRPGLTASNGLNGFARGVSNGIFGNNLSFTTLPSTGSTATTAGRIGLLGTNRLTGLNLSNLGGTTTGTTSLGNTFVSGAGTFGSVFGQGPFGTSTLSLNNPIGTNFFGTTLTPTYGITTPTNNIGLGLGAGLNNTNTFFGNNGFVGGLL